MSWCRMSGALRISIVIACLIVLAQFTTAKHDSLCERTDPRPPPGGCCPKRFSHLCCPIFGEDKILPCSEKQTRNRSTSRNAIGPGQKSPVNSLPDPRKACVHSWSNLACAGGFYLSLSTGKPTPCPKGFFCPIGLFCVIPCPQGAYCVRGNKTAETSDKSSKCHTGLGICCDQSMPLLLNTTGPRKCNGVNDPNCLCGGAEEPEPCPGGFYCPDPRTKIPCDKGYYCRPGSTSPDPCPWLSTCNRQSSAPLKNYIAALLDVLILLLFVVLYLVYNNYKKIKFYCDLYVSRFTGRPRSGTTSYQVDAGVIHVVNQLSTFTEGSDDIQPKSYTIDIRFDNLGLELTSGENKGKVVLHGVTGEIRHGEVTAVMGPSGAGKTTFLNTLSGKAYYGKTTGEILFNNQQVRGIKEYRSLTGFVPQEDIMHRNLKVREVLYYQAVLRLPSGVDTRTIKYKIKQVLNILEIGHVADSLIGDEETRGISGGQRKRVNIGMELIADPTLLFLDEPTSGLDSTSSLSVLKSLRTVAEKGKLTILCVIHQPRFEIFNMFHNILLLGPGGMTVYQGSVPGAKDYFSALGFETPANLNPADYYMDVIGGSVKAADERDVDLFGAWNDHLARTKMDNPRSDESTSAAATVSVEKRDMPSPLLQFLTFVRREILLQVRSVKTLLIDTFLVFIAGGILGALYLEVRIEKFTALTRMSGMAIGLTAMLASLRCFGNHRTTFWRESAAGVNRVSYFLAVNFAQLSVIVMMPLVYLSLLYTLSSPRSYFVSHYTAVLCLQLCCTGMGYAISTIFNPKSSQMASVVIVLVMAMISGASPTLCKLDKLDFFGPLGYNLSFVRWFVEALFEKEALRYPPVMRPVRDRIAFQDHYTLDGNYSFCLGIIIVMAVVYRLFALLFLLFTNRGKQQ